MTMPREDHEGSKAACSETRNWLKRAIIGGERQRCVAKGFDKMARRRSNPGNSREFASNSLPQAAES